ncbi:hypothetical protein MBT84_05895 [Streptomyces sp. MBT84]|uniref:hypothetical protein n=1 Tax=Streptomyces sp. MBT84 TaxID=1488414 RepID=UPI001D9D7EB4|nr:hypothetical protein [Streptomyces sp. MBT84]MBW8699114.1 hypothetical protein [Streptomyces sp. MBT84]
MGQRYQPGDTPASGPTGEAVTVDPAGIRPCASTRGRRITSRTAIRTAQEAFNQTYCKMLQQLEHAFNGNPAMLGMSVGTTYTIKG